MMKCDSSMASVGPAATGTWSDLQSII